MGFFRLWRSEPLTEYQLVPSICHCEVFTPPVPGSPLAQSECRVHPEPSRFADSGNIWAWPSLMVNPGAAEVGDVEVSEASLGLTAVNRTKSPEDCCRRK